MGYSISWLAVRGKDASTVVASLDLTATGMKAEYGEAVCTGRSLPSGWFLLVLNRCEHNFIKPETLSVLSVGCKLVACSVEEHVMVSTAESWKNGARSWRIEHDAQQSIDHILKAGTLPDAYAAIERSLTQEQDRAGGKNADTDYFFDIPLQTAKSIVGFKHDEESGLEEGGFEIYEEGESNQQEYVSSRPRKRLLITMPIMLCGIFGVFFVGAYFDVFGSKIDFVGKPATYLFFVSMLVGLFGLIHTFFPVRTAIFGTTMVSFAFLLLYLGGKLSRGEL